MKSLQETFKEIVVALNNGLPEPLFHYAYGKDHWQNIYDHEKDGQLPFDERNKYVKLLYVDEDELINEYGGVEKVICTGECLFLASSHLADPSYEYKYETHIKKLKEFCREFRDKLTDCGSNLQVKKWTIVEVENIYDNNLDGVKVKFTINGR